MALLCQKGVAILLDVLHRLDLYAPLCSCGRCLDHTACMVLVALAKGFVSQYCNLQNDGIRNSIF